MDIFNNIIFGKKKLSDLMQEIYDNQKSKKSQILTLISELQPLVRTTGDASVLVPLIKEYLDMGIKNDKHLIELVSITQRILAQKDNKGGDSFMSDKDKEALDKLIEELNKK